MPSSVLNNQVPHSILFPKGPLYQVPLHMFRCTCFVHDLSPGQDKLSARAIKCVFLGYSRLQKGYRCYSPITHCRYISADVTFFEDTPYFTSPVESNIVSEVLPVPCFGQPMLSLQEPSVGTTESSVVLPDTISHSPLARPWITYHR